MQDVEQGRKAPFEEPSARARMLASQWRDQPPPTTPWRGDAPSVGDATAPARKPAKGKGRWVRGLAIAIIIGALGTVVAVQMLTSH
jgi:hypothetical protein